MEEKKVRVTKDGPYEVTGGIPLRNQMSVPGKEGHPEFWKKGKGFDSRGTYLLCRCGKSGNKPFCDGTHARIGFEGT